MSTWISSLFQRETVPLLEASMGFAHHKHLTITNNIANVENPYYKPQGVPEKRFLQLLDDAIEERRKFHIDSFRIRDGFDIRFRDNHYPVPEVDAAQEFGPERHDENSVVIEKEMAELAKNTQMIQTMQQLFRKKLSMLRSSLRDRVA